MQLFGCDLSTSVAVIAEIGVNHEGDLAVALKILRQAASAGVHAVKLQSYTPARYASASDPERLARVSRFALDEAAHRVLLEEAARLNIPLFSTPVTEDWVPFLAANCPAIKIASGDLTFEPVIRAAAQTGKPVILSTGCGNVDEIDRAVGWVRDEVGTQALAERLVLMHCVSAYPTPVDQANVRTVPYLAERYGVTVGYSHHVMGPEAALAAVALGAAVVEVHVTDHRENRTFRDHDLSFVEQELAALVRSVAAVRASLGNFDKRVQPSEIGNRDLIRKGVAAATELAAGRVLTEADLMYCRPATHFPAADRPILVGRRLTRALARGELVTRDVIED